MSYEGYREYLCSTGHHTVRDCNDDDPSECDICGGAITHWHSVDQTNGMIKGDPSTMRAPTVQIGIERYTAERPLYSPGAHWRTVRPE